MITIAMVNPPSSLDSNHWSSVSNFLFQTAVAGGDLTQKVTGVSSILGKMLNLINTIINQLTIPTEQVYLRRSAWRGILGAC
jgi:hypothetical protein